MRMTIEENDIGTDQEIKSPVKIRECKADDPPYSFLGTGREG